MSLATIFSLLLQISEGANALQLPSEKKDAGISVLTLIMKGGWVMIPIFILSFLSFYIIIERILTLSKAAKVPNDFMPRVKQHILNGDINGAKMLCAQTDSPVSRMIEKGVNRLGRPLKDIESAVENTGKIEVLKLEKNINVLGIISGIAPMLGFVGTIAGVITIFYNIALEENISIGGVAEGLYQKMVTSAAGLIVGIISHVGYHYLNLRIERIVFKMESSAMELIDLLQENK
ncbi:MAG: MotA/TolQ/ExbB proton channel family protein [Cytophagales bacterium]